MTLSPTVLFIRKRYAQFPPRHYKGNHPIHEGLPEPAKYSCNEVMHADRGIKTSTAEEQDFVIVGDRPCLFVGCLTSQQQASVSQGQICSDKFTCCHTEIQVADQTFYLTQSQYTDTGPTSPSADPITPGA